MNVVLFIYLFVRTSNKYSLCCFSFKTPVAKLIQILKKNKGTTPRVQCHGNIVKQHVNL